jgi:hypothetical protein
VRDMRAVSRRIGSWNAGILAVWRPLTDGKPLLWLVPVFPIFVALGCAWYRRLAASLTAGATCGLP